MKPRKLTLISSVLLALLMVGTVVILYAGKPPKPLIADQVKFTPKHIDMENTANIEVQIKLFEGKNPQQQINIVDEINASTVLLEGMIAPISTRIEYTSSGQPQDFIAEFSGGAVKGVIWYIIGHMGITLPPHPWNPIPLELTITGQLYDGTPWEGTGTVSIQNWAGGDPPPPPPP